MPHDEESFDFDAFQKAFDEEHSDNPLPPLDATTQAEDYLRNNLLTAVKRICNIAHNSESDTLALKASIYIADRVLGKEPLMVDPAKALVDRLTRSDTQ